MSLAWWKLLSLFTSFLVVHSQSFRSNSEFHSLSSGLNIRVETPSSYDDIFLIQSAANSVFAPLGHFRQIFTTGVVPEQFLQNQVKSLKHKWNVDARFWLFKAVLTGKGDEDDLDDADAAEEIIGGAQWDIYSNGLSERERTRPSGAYKPMEGIDHEYMTWYFRTIRETREKVFGAKPHIILSMLFVVPEYRRKGIGSKLLLWGINKGEERNLPIYLEATTPEAHQLYKQNGFIAVEDLGLDPQQYGLRDISDSTPMIKLPSSYGPDGVSQFFNTEI